MTYLQEIEITNTNPSGYIMNEKLTKKPKNVDYFHIPRPLWRRLRHLLPKSEPHPRGGRHQQITERL